MRGPDASGPRRQERAQGGWCGRVFSTVRWPWRWRNPAAHRTAQERSSPATATCPWCSSTPTCGDGVSTASCCRDCTSVHRKGDGAERRCGHGRRTGALDACTKARDTERQATGPHLATVAPSSSSSVKHADPRHAVVDRASGTSTLSGPLQQQPHRGKRPFTEAGRLVHADQRPVDRGNEPSRHRVRVLLCKVAQAISRTAAGQLVRLATSWSQEDSC